MASLQQQTHITKRRPFLTIWTLAVLAFLHIPILIVILYSFNAGKSSAAWQGFTFNWYAELAQDSRIAEALWNSLTIAAGSTLLSTIIGTCCALALRGSSFRGKKAAAGLLLLPILLPEILIGISLLVLFSQFYIPLGKLTILIAHVTFSISYVYLLVAARLEGLNPQMEEAASDLGASGWQTFRHVTLPLIAPGVLAGAILAFTLSIDDFLISFFVAGPNSTTLPIYIYGLVKRGISPEINALCTVLIVLTLALVALAEYFRTKGIRKEEKHETTV